MNKENRNRLIQSENRLQEGRGVGELGGKVLGIKKYRLIVTK